MTRRLLTVLLVVVAACSAGADEGLETGSTDDRSAVEPATISVAQVESSPREDVPSALANMRDDSFPDPLIDPDAVRSGGPPPDGIPPIDEPVFARASEVGFLTDAEPVLALEVDGDARAYPIQIMIWHEIVNDTVGGVPVSVTYCPLCNSAIAYDRRFGDRILDFGTSGRLYNSALVMYDRQTRSLWSHFTGEAVIGFLTGAQLEVFPVSTVSWGDFRDAYPDGLVLTTDTGHSRDYGRNPYPGYDDVATSPFLFDGEVDGRLVAKERVIGIELGDDAAAVRLSALFERRVGSVEVDDQELVVWVSPGTSSALDSGSVTDGRDVGATGVFVPRVDDTVLEFEPDGSDFVDLQTGSRWNVLGHAIAGPLEGAALEPVAHVDTFWFAWGAFKPDSRVVDFG